MKRLLVDMDGVLADIYQQMFAWDERETGRRKTPEEVAGRREYDAFPNLSRHLHQPGFFREAPVMTDSREVLVALSARYEVFVVSAALEFPGSLPEKHAWLQEHFPFIAWQQIVFCGSKRVVQGDIMIDDHFKNLDAFTEKTLLFTQPHNITDNRGHERVNSWKEVAARLL